MNTTLMDSLEGLKQHLREERNKAADLLTEITSDADIIHGFQVFIEGGFLPGHTLSEVLEKKIMSPMFMTLKVALSDALINTFIPNEIKKILLIQDTPIFKSLGILRKFNLKNQTELEQAYILFKKSGHECMERLSRALVNANLTAAELEILNRINRIHDGYEYASSEELTGLGMSQDTINLIKKDRIMIDLVAKKLCDSYKHT